MYRALCTVEFRGRGALVRRVDGVEALFCFPGLEMEVTMFPLGRQRQLQARDGRSHHRVILTLIISPLELINTIESFRQFTTQGGQILQQ
jgi:hypothetical protein